MASCEWETLKTLWPQVGGLDILRLNGMTRPHALLKRESQLLIIIFFY